MRRVPLYAFFTANAISFIGNNLTMIAVPWFVLETTGSAVKTGLVGFFTALPAILAAFFGGALVDRTGTQRMSILSDLASGVTVALIPLLYLTIGLQFWQLLILVFLSALLDAPGNTARSALLPDLAQEAQMRLERANAADQTIQRGASLVGPALAGLLIAWVGTRNVLWLDAASFAISAGLFALAVPSSKSHAAGETRYVDQLKDGLRFVRGDRLILTIVLTIAITNFLDAPLFAVVLPVYARQLYGDASRLGFMISVVGAGAVLGTILYGAVGHRLPRRLTYILSFILVSLPLLVLAFTPPYPIVLGVLFFAGIAAGPINPVLMTVGQERVPAELRGRVFGMITAVAYIAIPLGMLLAGLAVERFSVSVTLFIIAACYLLVTTAQAFNSALREMDGKEGRPDVEIETSQEQG
jgi:MFS family permease